MASKPDALLPSAGDFMTKLALAEAEEAAKQAKKLAEAEAEKRALLDQLNKPSGLSDEEAIRRAIKIIERAVSNGLTEVQVHRFPNQLCTDRGRPARAPRCRPRPAPASPGRWPAVPVRQRRRRGSPPRRR